MVEFMKPLLLMLLLAALAPRAISPREIVRLANSERARPLMENERLTEAAERKLEDMIEKDYFDHTHGSSTPWSFMREAGYRYTAAAENLGRGFRTAEEAHRAWMKSKGHRQNILGDFTDIGVAVKGDVIVVMFGKR
jgi:uncharacterized protein YkwD